MSSEGLSKPWQCDEQEEENKTEKWNFEKIRDFQSRLGFLDTRYLGEKLQHFNRISEVSCVHIIIWQLIIQKHNNILIVFD